MMAHDDASDIYPTPFSLDGGLLTALQLKHDPCEEKQKSPSTPSNSIATEEDTRDAALILTSLSSTTTDNDTPHQKITHLPSLPLLTTSCPVSPKFSHLVSVFEEEYQHEKKMEKNRIRAVSFSHPNELEGSSSFPSLSSASAESLPITYPDTLSPPLSPVVKKSKKKKSDVAIVSPIKSALLRPCDGGKVKTILRKKFSWKNYPELEAFLIANREEYLRHSALNYTIQQKKYNNRLTERLLELASTHGYVFDQDAFSFVTVRDRIRCYYKSYVQSSKKRGIIIGYAARRAGLLSEDDLERSAGMAGRIVVPSLD